MSREETGLVEVPDDVHAAAMRIKAWAASNMVSNHWRLHGLCPDTLVTELEARIKVLEHRLRGREGYKDWLGDVQEKAGRQVNPLNAQLLHAAGASVMDAVVALCK